MMESITVTPNMSFQNDMLVYGPQGEGHWHVVVWHFISANCWNCTPVVKKKVIFVPVIKTPQYFPLAYRTLHFATKGFFYCQWETIHPDVVISWASDWSFTPEITSAVQLKLYLGLFKTPEVKPLNPFDFLLQWRLIISEAVRVNYISSLCLAKSLCPNGPK